jgi:hypothetical protein
LPSWLVPVGLVEMVDGWIKRLPRSLDDVRGESAEQPAEVHGEPVLRTETSQR